MKDSPDDEGEGIVVFRWTVDTFYKAIRAKLFAHPERLELIHGEVIERVAPQMLPHSAGVMLCVRVCRSIFPAGHVVRSQMPLDVGKSSEPEPDVLVVIGDERDYEQRQPRPENVRLLIEVSDTTLGYDRNPKMATYAEAGIAGYWVLDLRSRRLEVRREPVAAPQKRYGWKYNVKQDYTESDAVSPLAAPDAVIQVADLLPRLRPEPDVA